MKVGKEISKQCGLVDEATVYLYSPKNKFGQFLVALMYLVAVMDFIDSNFLSIFAVIVFVAVVDLAFFFT